MSVRRTHRPFDWSDAVIAGLAVSAGVSVYLRDGRVRLLHKLMSVPRPHSPFDWSAAVIARLAVSAGVAVYLRDGSERFLAILMDDISLFGTMLPRMLAGCLMGAFVTLL